MKGFLGLQLFLKIKFSIFIFKNNCGLIDFLLVRLLSEAKNSA